MDVIFVAKKVYTPEENIKRYGRELIFIGTFYFVVAIINTVLIIFNSYAFISIPFIIGLIVSIILPFMMGHGIKKRKQYGITIGWLFEATLLYSTITALLGLGGGPDIIGIIVMIFLPFELLGYSKALKQLNQ